MNTLTWNLSTPAAQIPEYWLLFVDGFAYASLDAVAPYTGVGQYSADLDALLAREALAAFAVPLAPGPHTFSVALVGQNSMGPQSPAAALDYTPPVAVSMPTLPAPSVPLVWPAADTVVAVAALATSTVSVGPSL
jgi:hypothetical protein